MAGLHRGLNGLKLVPGAPGASDWCLGGIEAGMRHGRWMALPRALPGAQGGLHGWAAVMRM